MTSPPIFSAGQRIDELIQHHKTRATEAAAVVADRLKTAYQIASDMTWGIKFDAWENFPVLQKWFATGETIAHLRYLEDEGRIVRKTKNGRIVYTCV